MPRYRLIPTNVNSAADLQRTLTEMGLRNVELHAQPAPLNDWIGRPTDVMAHAIVRRKDLGSSSDDLGFVRNAGGTFDALVSEIHLFRFDKKWFEELARRNGADVPTTGPRQFAASISSPTVIAHVAGKPAGAAPSEIQSNRARLEAAELLENVRKSQRVSQVGCLLFFLPVLPWLLLGTARGRLPDVTILLAMWAGWTVIYFFALITVLAMRFAARAREFAQRFHKGSEGRAAAIAHLRSVAEDKKNAATGIAGRLLERIEKDARAKLTQRPPTPRGPGATRP